MLRDITIRTEAVKKLVNLLKRMSVSVTRSYEKVERTEFILISI